MHIQCKINSAGSQWLSVCNEVRSQGPPRFLSLAVAAAGKVGELKKRLDSRHLPIHVHPPYVHQFPNFLLVAKGV